MFGPPVPVSWAMREMEDESCARRVERQRGPVTSVVGSQAEAPERLTRVPLWRGSVGRGQVSQLQALKCLTLQGTCRHSDYWPPGPGRPRCGWGLGLLLVPGGGAYLGRPAPPGRRQAGWGRANISWGSPRQLSSGGLRSCTGPRLTCGFGLGHSSQRKLPQACAWPWMPLRPWPGPDLPQT